MRMYKKEKKYSRGITKLLAGTGVCISILALAPNSYSIARAQSVDCIEYSTNNILKEKIKQVDLYTKLEQCKSYNDIMDGNKKVIVYSNTEDKTEDNKEKKTENTNSKKKTKKNIKKKNSKKTDNKKNTSKKINNNKTVVLKDTKTAKVNKATQENKASKVEKTQNSNNQPTSKDYNVDYATQVLDLVRL